MKIKDISLNNALLLHEGITNQSFLIDNKYVYRHKEEINDPFNKSENEFAVLKQINCYPFVEKIIDYDIKTGEKLSLYIDKTTRLSKPYKKEEFKLIADILKIIHKEVKIGFSFEPFKRLEVYKRNIESKIDINKEKEIINKAKKLYEKYPLCFCHNDIVYGNILFQDNRAYLLDFEYAGNNIEIFDIASFISENNIDNSEYIDYFISLFKADKNDIYTMIKFQNVLWYYWALYSYKNNKREIFLKIAEDKFNNI